MRTLRLSTTLTIVYFRPVLSFSWPNSRPVIHGYFSMLPGLLQQVILQYLLYLLLQVKLGATLEGGSRKQTRSTDKVVDKLRRVRIVDRYIIPASAAACYGATRFFGTAICNSEKLEKKPKSSRDTVQLTTGWSKSCARIEGNLSTNWCGRTTQ